MIHKLSLLTVTSLFAISTVTSLIGAIPVYALNSYLCNAQNSPSFSPCIDNGYTAHGYENHYLKQHWLAFAGHNCTNYVGYMLTQNGDSGPGVPMGHANMWDNTIKSHPEWGYHVDKRPAVGSIALWDYAEGSNSGHVAYVESVFSDRIIISEDNAPTFSAFRWRVIAKDSESWPHWFLHIADIPQESNKSDVDGNKGSDLLLTTNEADGTFKVMAGLSTYNFFQEPKQWLRGDWKWNDITPLSGDVNGDGNSDFVMLTNESANGTKAFVSMSNSNGFSSPIQWWHGTGWGYGGIKPILR